MPSNDGTFGITGIPPPDNVQRKTVKIPYVVGMPLRHEITEWFEKMLKTGDATMWMQWTLFVRGLEKFKALPVEEKLSYFQVAGIHGSPELPWDGAPAPQRAPKADIPGENPFGGYCHHNTVAFPTWHRPYMLLYEVWLFLHHRIDC